MRTPLPFCAVLLLIGSANAAPMVDQSHVVTQSVGGLVIDEGFYSGQSFTAGSQGLLSQIDVLLRRDAGDIGSLSLELWPVVSGSPVGTSPLFTTPIDPAAVPVGSASYVEVDVSQGGLSVMPGDEYVFAVSGTASRDGPRASWTRGFPGYADGSGFARTGSWSPLSGDFDFGFRTWVDPTGIGAGDTLTLAPTFDVEASFPSFGLPFLIDGAGQITVARQRSSSTDDRRAMVEFDLLGLPDGSNIVGATLELDVVGFSSNSSLQPVVEVFGYSGDGVARPANADNLSTLLGTSQPVDSTGTLSIPLSGPSIADLVEGNGQLGIVLYQQSTTLDVDFASSEWATQFPDFFQAPTLTVSYESPTPVRLPDGDYNGDARVDAADYTVWRDATSTNDLAADGNGDGMIDGQDEAIWRAAYGVEPDDNVNNGDFGSGDLSGWTTVIEPNTSVPFGFPRVETFDVTGDSFGSDAARVRLGRTDTNEPGGTVAFEQELLFEGGDYLLLADIASQSLDPFGNTAPGNYELLFDGVVVDVVALNGTLIESLEVLRDSLQATLTDVEPGYHTVRIAINRGATTFASIYHFIDNVQLFRIGSGRTVPEPEGALLLAVASTTVLLRRQNEMARRGRRPAC